MDGVEMRVTIRFPHIDAAGIVFYPRCYELLARSFPASPLDMAPVVLRTRFLRPLRLGDTIDLEFHEQGARAWFSARKSGVEHFRVELAADSECSEPADGYMTQAGTLSDWACGPSGRMSLSRSFEYLSIAVEEYLEYVLEMPFHELHLGRRIGIPTVQFSTVVRSLPAAGDRVHMETRTEAVGTKSLTLRHALRRGQECLAVNRQVLVFVEMLEDAYRSVPIPADLRDHLMESIDVAA